MRAILTTMIKLRSRLVRTRMLVAVAACLPMLSSAACDLVLSSQEVNYGRLTQQALRGGSVASLGARHVSVDAICRSSGQLSIIVSGAEMNKVFQFGQGGQLKVLFQNAILDGHQIGLGLLSATGELLDVGANVSVEPGQRLVLVRNGRIVAGRNLSMQAVIAAEVPRHVLRLSQEQEFDARIKFQVEFDEFVSEGL